MRNVRPASVLDVGCGDGEATRGLHLEGYTGLDVSEEAIRLARLTRPEGAFHVGTIREWPGKAELTICLDVLIHQADADDYRATVAALLKATTRVLLVSGYEHPPSGASPMVHFHDSLSVTLKQADPAVRCHLLREIHEITTLAVVKPPFERNWQGRRSRLWTRVGGRDRRGIDRRPGSESALEAAPAVSESGGTRRSDPTRGETPVRGSCGSTG